MKLKNMKKAIATIFTDVFQFILINILVIFYRIENCLICILFSENYDFFVWNLVFGLFGKNMFIFIYIIIISIFIVYII